MNGITSKDEPIQKVYWHMTEISEMFHIAQSKVRYWEKELGLHFRRRHGKRIFMQEDIDKIREIVFMIDIEGFTLWGVRRRLEGL